MYEHNRAPLAPSAAPSTGAAVTEQLHVLQSQIGILTFRMPELHQNDRLDEALLLRYSKVSETKRSCGAFAIRRQTSVSNKRVHLPARLRLLRRRVASQRGTQRSSDLRSHRKSALWVEQ